MIDEIMELTPLDQKVNALLYKAGYYLHTYRAIDALNVLLEAHRMVEGQSVHWRVRTAVLKNTGQAYIQLGQYEKGLACFAQSYDIIEDGDDKAAAAGHLAGYFLLELLNQAAAYAEEAHCLTDLAMAISDLAAVYNEMGRMEIALSEMFRAERYAKESRNLDLMFRFVVRRAKIMYKMGKDEEAKTLIMTLDEQKN